MSLRRLAATAAVMAAVAALLSVLTRGLPDPAVLTAPQAVADASGPETLLVALVGLAAWTAWGWGALGLLLTALSVAPGLLGAAARGAGRLLLPAGARQAAAVALGVGLTVGVPVLSGCVPATAPAAAVQSLPAAVQSPPDAGPVPDWPAAPAPAPPPPPSANSAPSAAPDPAPGAAPDPGTATGRPTPPPVPDWPDGRYVVVRGDCLWDVAAADLRARTGGDPAAAEVTRAVAAWWTANAAVIGDDPDLLLPGQVLRAPADPTAPAESEHP